VARAERAFVKEFYCFFTSSDPPDLRENFYFLKGDYSDSDKIGFSGS
jgi:hypothetical protein